MIFIYLILIKNIRNVAKKFKNESLDKDLAFIQKLPNKKLFEQAGKLIQAKYPDCDLKKYFENVNKWGECYAKGFPSTNNGIESTNASIKERKTLRERLETNVFLSKAKDLIRDWSRRRTIVGNESNQLIFNLLPKVSLEKWTSAFHLAKKNSNFICKVIL